MNAGANVTRPLHEQGCLFCRRSDGGFASEEHVFPYALGNREFVLPRGVVCDRCNNGPLAKADEAITSFPPIKLLCAERLLTSRRNKPQVLNVHGSQVWGEGRGELRVRAGRPGVVTRTGPSSGTLMLSTGKPTPERIFRHLTYGVWKVALEDLYRQHGPGVGFASKYDRVRQAVVGIRETRGWCFCPKSAQPHDTVAIHLQPATSSAGGERMLVCLEVFGINFVTDLLALDLEEEEIFRPTDANLWIFGPTDAARMTSNRS